MDVPALGSAFTVAVFTGVAPVVSAGTVRTRASAKWAVGRVEK